MPVPDAIATAKKVIDTLPTAALALPKEDYLKLLILCLDSNIFTVDDLYYQQHRGLVMGSPLSPVLACLFLKTLEKQNL